MSYISIDDDLFNEYLTQKDKKYYIYSSLTLYSISGCILLYSSLNHFF